MKVNTYKVNKYGALPARAAYLGGRFWVARVLWSSRRRSARRTAVILTRAPCPPPAAALPRSERRARSWWSWDPRGPRTRTLRSPLRLAAARSRPRARPAAPRTRSLSRSSGSFSASLWTWWGHRTEDRGQRGHGSVRKQVVRSSRSLTAHKPVVSGEAKFLHRSSQKTSAFPFQEQ